MAAVACESSIERVVVYARGARITRQVRLPQALPTNEAELLIEGLTPQLEHSSLRALVEGDRPVVSTKALLTTPPALQEEGDLKRKLKENQRALDRVRSRLRARTDRGAELERASLNLALTKPKNRSAPDARVQDALAAVSMLSALQLEHDEAAMALALEEIELVEARQALELAAAQADRAALSSGVKPAMKAQILIGPGEALSSLSLEYTVPQARWWPAYVARLSEQGKQARLELDAFVAQDTGEDWADVDVALSTADRVLDLTLPKLDALRLGKPRPPKRSGYRPPPEGTEALFSGYDEALAAHRAQKSGIKLPESHADILEALHEDRSTMTTRDAPARAPLGGEGALTVEEDGVFKNASAPPMPQGPAPEITEFASVMPASMSMDMAMPAEAKSGSMLLGAVGAVAGGAMAGAAAVGDLLRSEAPSGSIQSSKKMAKSRSGRASDRIASVSGYAEPEADWLEFDRLQLSAGKNARGKLTLSSASVRAASAAIDTIALEGPLAALEDPLRTRGRFDHQYLAEGTVQVPSSGRPHRISLVAAEGKAAPRFVVVPSQSDAVYRESLLTNPFDGPLLAGPVDVFLDGALITSTRLDGTDRGAELVIGLGVEDRLRVARNVRVEETSSGMISSHTHVDHHVEIELASSLGHEAKLDVFDRIPVSDDRALEIELLASQPAAERDEQDQRGPPVKGGLRFSIALKPGEKRKLNFSYRISMSTKLEIRGGNRRD